MATFSNKPLGFIYDYKGRAQTLWELTDLTLSSINGIPISSFGAGTPYFRDLGDQQVTPGNPGTILYVSSDGETIIPLGIGNNLTVSSGSIHATGGGAGVSYFSSLIDTFSSYLGKAGDFVSVRADGTGLSSIPSGTFALAANLANYMPTSVSSSFALVTSLSLYIPYTASGQFASSSVSGWVGSNFVHVSGGDNITGGLSAQSFSSANFNGLSATLRQVSATTFLNLPSATTGQAGVIRALDNITTHFLAGDGTWLTPAGGGGTGSPSGPNTSVQWNNANQFSGTQNMVWDNATNTLKVSSISALNYQNLPSTGGGVSSFSSLADVSTAGGFYTGASGNLVQINASGTKLISIPSGTYLLSSASSLFLQTATSAQFASSSVSANFANYIPTSVSNTFSTTAVSGWVASNFVHVSGGDTVSGTTRYIALSATTLSALSATIKQVSATTFVNLPSATTLVPGVVTPPGGTTTFLRADGSWVVPPVSGTGGASYFSSLLDVSAGFTYSGTSGNLIVVNASATGLSSMAFSSADLLFLASSTFLTPAQALSSFIPVSGGSATGYISGLYPTASSHFVTKAYADSLSGTGMSQSTADSRYFPLSGAKAITGPVSGHSTSAFFNTISATTYLNVTGLGSGGVSNFSSLSEVSSIRNPWFTGASGHMVVVSPSANGLSSVAISSTPITFLDVSSFIPVSGGVSATGYISGLYPTASSHFVTKAYADNLTGTGMSQGVAEALFVNVSGDSMTGGLSGLTTSAIFGTISATTYLNLNVTGGGGGVSYFSALTDVSGSKPNFYTGASGDFVVVNASATGLSSVAFTYVDPATYYTASDAVNYAIYAESAFLNASGDTMGGNLNMGGYAINNVGQISAVSGFFTHLSATNYYNVTAGIGGGSPGGSPGQVQYNAGGGSFAGDANFTYASALGKVSVSTLIAIDLTGTNTAFTTIVNTPSGQTPTLSQHIATKGYVDSLSSNYIPIGSSSTFASSAVSAWVGSNFVHVSGNDNITGSISAVGLSATNLSGISGIIRNISATTYFNLPAFAVSSADGFLTSSQGNAAFVNTSGDTMTGNLLAPALSSTTISSLTATFNTISATTYQNLGNSLTNYAISSAANPLVLSSVLSANYLTTGTSSTFSTTAVSGWVGSNFVHVSGNDNITGSISAVGLSATNLSAISGIIRNVSATTYFNLTNSLPANIAISSTDGFLTSSQGNLAFVNTSGDTMTGGLVAPSLSSTTLSSISAVITLIANTASGQTPTLAGHLATKGYVDSQVAGGGLTQAAADPLYVNVSGDSMTGGLSGLTTSAFFGTISATTYLNLNVTGGGGVSYFSALTDVSGTRNPWFASTSGHMVVVNASATGLSSVAVSTTPITFIDTSSVLFTSGGTLTGALSGHSTSAFFKTISATTYVGVTAAGDNLGNHTATTNLNMGGFDISNVGDISATYSISTLSSYCTDIFFTPDPDNPPSGLSAPASSLILHTRTIANRIMPELVTPWGRDYYLQAGYDKGWLKLVPATGTLLPVGIGVTPVTAAPTTHLNATGLPLLTYAGFGGNTRLARMPHWTLQATAVGMGYVKSNPQYCHMGSSISEGGWFLDTVFTVSSTIASLSSQAFVGLAPTAAPTNVNLTAFTNFMGFGYASSLFTLAGPSYPELKVWWGKTGPSTSSVGTGISAAPSSLIRCTMYNPGNLSGFYWEVKEVNTGVTSSGSVINDPRLPSNTTFFTILLALGSSGNAAQMHVANFYLEYPIEI